MGLQNALAAVLGVILLAAAPVSAAAQDHPGAQPYRQVCQLCHGDAGGGDIAPALVPFGFDADYVLAVVREGYGQMPPISRRELDDDAVRQVAGYLEVLTSPPAARENEEAEVEAAEAGGRQQETAAEASYDGPRTPEGQPDLNGIWQTLNAASWDIRAHNAQDGVPAGLGVVEGGEIPYQPWGGGAATGELRQPAHRGSGAEVLPAGGAAHHLHAVPVPHPADPRPRRHHLRVRARGPHHLHRRQSPSAAQRLLDGRLARPLGRRHAGGRHHALQRPDLVRRGGQLPQRPVARRGALQPRSPHTTSTTR